MSNFNLKTSINKQHKNVHEYSVVGNKLTITMELHLCNNRRSNSVIFLLLIIFSSANLSPSSASPIAVAAGEKVELSLYYEALCPYCENFILNYLYKIFDNGLISIVDLKLSPYGNAKIRDDNTIVCQVNFNSFIVVFN